MTNPNGGTGVKSPVKPLVHYDVTGASGLHEWREPISAPRPLYSPDWLARCAQALQGSQDRREALWRERGITAETADEYGIGWDERRDVWLIPIWDRWGSLVNFSHRPPKGSGRDPWRVGGRRAENGCLPLWPDVPEHGPLCLVGGEWDALVGRQHELPTITGLAGALWHEAWNPEITGRRVAVAYDQGEERFASQTVSKLRAAGAEAWVVPMLSRVEGFDLVDWFQVGRTREQFIRLVRRCRP